MDIPHYEITYAQAVDNFIGACVCIVSRGTVGCLSSLSCDASVAIATRLSPHTPQLNYSYVLYKTTLCVSAHYHHKLASSQANASTILYRGRGRGTR